MSGRKQTVDGLDDIDDEDGVVEEEACEENDLTLRVETADEVIMGNLDELDEEEIVEEEEEV